MCIRGGLRWSCVQLSQSRHGIYSHCHGLSLVERNLFKPYFSFQLGGPSIRAYSVRAPHGPLRGDGHVGLDSRRVCIRREHVVYLGC
jgi:hypothetical protein